ncbi:MAG TPA: HTTM domain-containing protein [Cyclobacteriaceae bacterium]
MATKAVPTNFISIKNILNYMEQPVSVAPLVIFRMGFGLVMLFSTVRYMAMGWVDTQLIDSVIHFHYFGFDWIKPLPGTWMYAVFVLMILSSLGILVGFLYRLSAILFFLCFSYVELIDITYYLNHYYFVSIVSFLLILVPANQFFSLDARRNPDLLKDKVSRWCIGILKLQIAIVYVYAGLAKINYDWLINALPLSIWLPAKSSIPVIGFLFEYHATAYVFSWIGMFFDTFIIFGLLWHRSRWISYFLVIIFHTLTGILFQIGVFPLVMIFAVTIFFSGPFHLKIINGLSKSLNISPLERHTKEAKPSPTNRLILPFLFCYFLFQVLFPWRYLFYPGNVFWTEEGYRFAWRVMLMEKAGTATFYVKDGPGGKEGAVINREFLRPHQEKQMAMQPDMILQFAHFLDEHFKLRGMNDPYVRVEAWVTLNARPAHLLIDPQKDLTTISDGWGKKDWILPYHKSPER